MRFIVFGGRDYADEAEMTAWLSILDPSMTLVHGAATGADALAASIWKSLGGPIEPHPADWTRNGKAAGPLRNQEMVNLGAAFALGFPGGRGTADMQRRLRAADIPVIGPLTGYPE